MNGFFDATPEELEAAKKASGSKDRIPFKAGEIYSFLIKEVKLKDRDEGQMMIVVTDVIDGEFKGQEHAFFYRKWNKPSAEDGLRLLQSLLTPEQLRGGATPTSIVSRKFKAKCWHGKTGFVGFDQYTEISNTPELGLVSNDGADVIPF